MRFILNFIFFGILFYVIFLFFPDAFATLVSWANNAYEFLREIVLKISGKVHSVTDSQPVVPKTLFIPFLLFVAKLKRF